MPRYVILEHDHPALHWDLMLERDGVLRTWRLAAPPAVGLAVAAEAAFDHRLLYLDYEGPISGGRGQVKRWDGGTYQTEEEKPECWALCLDGGRLSGRAALLREPEGGWLFRLEASASGEDEVGGRRDSREAEGEQDTPAEPPGPA